MVYDVTYFACIYCHKTYREKDSAIWCEKECFDEMEEAQSQLEQFEEEEMYDNLTREEKMHF